MRAFQKNSESAKEVFSKVEVIFLLLINYAVFYYYFFLKVGSSFARMLILSKNHLFLRPLVVNQFNSIHKAYKTSDITRKRQNVPSAVQSTEDRLNISRRSHLAKIPMLTLSL